MKLTVVILSVALTLLFLTTALFIDLWQAALKPTDSPVTEVTYEITFVPSAPDYGLGWPIHLDDWPEGQLTSPYGERDAIGGSSDTFHDGIDLYGVSHVGTWRARIVAVASGLVVEHWPAPDGYWRGHDILGGLVIVEHDDGISKGVYGHLHETLVREGDRVTQGQVIGRQGRTGRAESDHLHFELWIDDEQVNALKYIGVPRQGGDR
jgi:murein DD-endopeptidase MepM/ murein hydrolase activator NlpD|tara:strand:+ start:407 stop:1030 length:624 start_codon:yes stop_codon:yes gene_type:complete